MPRKKVSSKAVTQLITKTHRQLAQLKDLEKLGAKITQLTSMADRAVEEYNEVTALLKVQMEGGQSYKVKMAPGGEVTSGGLAETGTEDGPETIPDPPDPTEPKPRKTAKAKTRASRKTFPVIRRKKPTNGRRRKKSAGRKKSAK